MEEYCSASKEGNAQRLFTELIYTVKDLNVIITEIVTKKRERE